MSETKIITPGFGDAKAEQAQPVRLNAKTANEIGGALQRLKELKEAKVQTPTSEAEVRGLIDFLANTLLTHAPELLGCWFVIRNEYEPLVSVLANITARVQSLRPKSPECAGGACPCKQ